MTCLCQQLATLRALPTGDRVGRLAIPVWNSRKKTRHDPVSGLSSWLKIRLTGHISRRPNPTCLPFTTGNLEAPQDCRAAKNELHGITLASLICPETSWNHAFIWSVDVCDVSYVLSYVHEKKTLCPDPVFHARPALTCLLRRGVALCCGVIRNCPDLNNPHSLNRSKQEIEAHWS